MLPELTGKGNPAFGGHVSRPLLPTRAEARSLRQRAGPRRPLCRLDAGAGMLGPGWRGAPGLARNHTGTRLGARSCLALPRGAALASRHLLSAEDGLPGPGWSARVPVHGERGRGPEAPSPPAAAAPSGAARSPGSAWFPPAAAAAAPPASASSGPPVGGGGSGREAGGSASGPVPYSPQSLKLTRPLAKLPTGTAFLPAWPCRRHHVAGPARPPRLWPWPLAAPTCSHRQGPAGVGPACVARGRHSCLDGAELLWSESLGQAHSDHKNQEHGWSPHCMPRPS